MTRLWAALPGNQVSYPGGIGDFVFSKAFVLALGDQEFFPRG